MWVLVGLLGAVLTIVTFFPNSLLGRMLWFPIPLTWVWFFLKVIILILASSKDDN